MSGAPLLGRPPAGASLRSRATGVLRACPELRAALLSAGALGRTLASARGGVYTLCYHHVAPAAAAGFRAQMALLARSGRIIGADDAVARIRAGRAGDERCFVVTFDDGYLDNVSVALPVLASLRIPATLFLVSDWLDAAPDDGQAYMGRDDVEAWLAAGLDIGSHTARHRRLSGLSGPEVADEMARSAEALARLRGGPVRHFACPWGVAHVDYRPEGDVAAAAAAGYETFFTTRRGRAVDGSSLMTMPRHVVEPEWPLSHLHTLMGGLRFVRR